MACIFLHQDAIAYIKIQRIIIRFEKPLSDYQKANAQSRFIMVRLLMD